MVQLNKTIPFLLIALLSGCVTISGNYNIKAVDDQGQDVLNGAVLMAQGKGIYTVRNAICRANPKATVIITDLKTGQELKSESPHRCR
jgi:hypothetical protein